MLILPIDYVFDSAIDIIKCCVHLLLSICDKGLSLLYSFLLVILSSQLVVADT